MQLGPGPSGPRIPAVPKRNCRPKCCSNSATSLFCIIASVARDVRSSGSDASQSFARSINTFGCRSIIFFTDTFDPSFLPLHQVAHDINLKLTIRFCVSVLLPSCEKYMRVLSLCASLVASIACSDLPPTPDEMEIQSEGIATWDSVEASTHTKASRPPEPVLIVDRKEKKLLQSL